METANDFFALLRPEPVADHQFHGTSLPLNSATIYGGQLLAQVLSAAAQTLPEARPAHHLHASFLTFGDPKAALEFEVSHGRDGRTTSQRMITVSQGERVLMTASASFQQTADGYDHQAPLPAVETPEALLENPDNHIDFDGEGESFPFLVVQQPGGREPRSQVWAKLKQAAPDDTELQQMLFAFLSDMTILQSALRPHAIDWDQPGLHVATMNHVIWFHRPVDVNGWLLMHGESPSATNGRGLSIVDTFDRQGTLVATMAQEGMVRIRHG